MWVNLPLHSTVEALGGLAAGLMGLVLLARKAEWEDERLQGVASGFLGMGMLEGFHAVSSPDQGFVAVAQCSQSPRGRGLLVCVASTGDDREAEPKI